MRTLKRMLLPTLIVLLAAGIVTTMLWSISKSALADKIRQTAGRDTGTTTTDIAPSAPTSPPEGVRTGAALIRVTLLAYLKIIVLMGIPGVLTLTVLTQMKRHARQPREG